MNKLFELEVLDCNLKELQAKRKELVASIIEDHSDKLQYGKSKAIKADGYKIVLKSTVTTKLDKDGILSAYDTLDGLPIRTKYELDKRSYDAMPSDKKAIFDEFVTANEAKSLTYQREVK